MKTKLPESITSVEQAEDFLNELFENGEAFHPEDNAGDIVWALPKEQQPTHNECVRLNNLMNEMFHLDDDFDPCAYFCDLVHEENRRMKLARPDPEQRYWDNMTTYNERDSDNGSDY